MRTDAWKGGKKHNHSTDPEKRGRKRHGRLGTPGAATQAAFWAMRVPAGHDERKQREANVGVHGRNNVGGRRANDRSPVHESIMEGAR